MPVARLITNTVEDADELAADLRGRGFTVEIVSPAEIPSYGVDLEIRVEECASEQALRSAEEASKKEDIHVFIAPGAIIESLRPIQMVPLMAECPDPMAEAEPIISPVADEVVTAQQMSGLSPAEDVIDEEIRIGHPGLASISEVQPAAWELPADIPEQPQVAEPVLESAVSQQPVVHAMESEEVYPPSDWPIWQPLVEADPPEEMVAAPVEAELAVPASDRAAMPFGRVLGNDRLFWRVAVVAGVVAVSALLLGVSAHRFSPVPRGLAGSGDERMPFEKRNNESAVPRTVGVPPAATPNQPPAPELKRVVARVPVVERPSPAEHLTRHVSRRKGVQRAATRQEDDYVAVDTVVRYGKKPAAPRVEAQKKPTIKHYSDFR